MLLSLLQAVAPELISFQDPQPSEPGPPREMLEAMDVLCPSRHNYITRSEWWPGLLAEMEARGADLWLYNAKGPARSLDPFSFYLVQEWHAYAIGATGSASWAFGDAGGTSCWNEYPATDDGPFCPTYLDDTSVTAAKYMEAIREGIEDFEYLTMLRTRIEELEGRGVTVPQATKDLLVEGPKRVLGGEEGANYRWDEPKDRSVQDAVRIEVLGALTELADL